MQQLIFDFTILVLVSVGIGIIGSMTGISGGAFKIPVLIIGFALSAELAAASSLLSAIFVAVVCTIVYYRQDPQLIDFRIGGLAVIITIPGSYVGVVLRTIVAQAHLLRLVFGIILFPVALKLILTQNDEEERANGQKRILTFSQLSRKKLAMTITAIFLAGVLAGLLGLGGGTIIVPLLCITFGFPMLMAAATSMFTMISTASAGSVINFLVLVQGEDLNTFFYFGLAIGVGMVIGGIIGPRYAARVDSVLLQKLFGFLLIFPLVKLMALGHLWLDPGGSSYMLATIGDVIIWLLISIPIWGLSSYRIKSRQKESNQKSSTQLP